MEYNFLNHRHFLIEPQEGNPIRLQPIKANNNILSRRSEVKLRQIAPLINRGDRIDQENVFAALGITLDRNQRLIRVKFIEHGCSYVDPESDRSKASDISSEDGFDMAIPQQKQVDFPIFYHVMVEKPFIHDGVNFFGRIEFESPIEEKEWRTVFMTGKGTVALEGRDNDCHAGYCTGPACASFQQRVAIILSAILALGASPDSQEIEDIRNHFRRINYHYHGRDHILEYTMDRCLGRINNDLSYLDYMRQIYAQDDDPMPKMLEHFLNFDLAPHENYYVKMKGKFKDEEVQEELKHFETHQQLMDKYLKMEIGEIPLKDFNEENFRDEILDAHNDMRRRHGAKPLKRNEELDRKAQEWAEYLYQKGLFVRNNFKYRNEPVGDSISVLVKNTDLDNPRRFVENWYEERKFYDYDIEPKTINDIRNFTQIVWQDTEELGSGAIGDESGRTYVVCLYWPAGNIRGQFLNNVTETKY